MKLHTLKCDKCGYYYADNPWGCPFCNDPELMKKMKAKREATKERDEEI